jgi:hypothetical protein
LSQSASHAETEVHVVRSVTVAHAVTTVAEIAVHVAMTKAHADHVAIVRMTHQ